MTVVLPDPGTEFGARVARRLHEDAIAWLTLTDQAGTPQPAPVWFLWDDDSSCVVLYSQPTARRLARMKANSRCSLHLNDDGTGHNLVPRTRVPQLTQSRLARNTGGWPGTSSNP